MMTSDMRWLHAARRAVRTSPDVVDWTDRSAHVRQWRHSSTPRLRHSRRSHTPRLPGLLQRTAERHLYVPPSAHLCTVVCRACSGNERYREKFGPSLPLSVCLSVCHTPQKRWIMHFRAVWLPRNTNRNPRAGSPLQWSAPPYTVAGSSRNGNETVACPASEAFARWLHHRYDPVKLPSVGHVVSRRNTLYLRVKVCSHSRRFFSPISIIKFNLI